MPASLPKLTIVNRDIHPGNVLVQRDADPSLGEAKAIDAVLPGRGSSSRMSRTELQEYLPPETNYTAVSDIFSWGQLALDVIRACHTNLLWEDGQIRFPERLILRPESCLANEVSERPTAAMLCTIIRDIT